MSQQMRAEPSIYRGAVATQQPRPPRASTLDRANPRAVHPRASSDDSRPALAKADWRVAVAAAMRPENDLVAGFEIGAGLAGRGADRSRPRSEEHTSELQS